MKRFASLAILVLLFTGFKGFCQKIDESYETLLLEEETSTTGVAFKPVISAGIGAFSFFGDATDYIRSPFSGLTSTRLAIGRNLNPYLDIEFHGTFGNVAGNSYNGTVTDTLNFKSSLFFGGVSLYYNFNHLLKRKRPIHPYISLGAEIVNFNPTGDLEDAFGNRYNYWTDGTIRDVRENSGLPGKIINRDYTYETTLRESNSFGTSVALPLEAGFHVAVSDRVTARVGAVMHIPFTDEIDNYKLGSSNHYDLVLNTYVSLSIDLFSAADEIAAIESFKNLKFTITDNVDEDGDKVNDFNDECPGTPKGVKVTFRGCPEDTDKDGVPDYLDKQMTPGVGKAIVGANGIRLMDVQLIVLLYDPEAVKRSEVKLYRSTKTSTDQNEQVKGIPDKFKIVDADGDNYISVDELNKAIDAIFEMNSTLTPDDIYELQEFFFNQ